MNRVRKALLKTLKPLKSRAGQILLPSLFAIPSLILFVYLIFEVAKLSREKIRHQFAVDAAAFIEMTNYSDFLNRTAYVNGPFPYRIFEEEWTQQKLYFGAADYEGGDISMADVAWESGAYPRGPFKVGNIQQLDKQDKWRIAFNEEMRPEIQSPRPGNEEEITFVSEKHAKRFNIMKGHLLGNGTPEDMGHFGFYNQVYTLLGSVEKSQTSVFEKLTANSSFFRKSYYLNTGECREDEAATCAEDGVASFSSNKFIDGIKPHYVPKISVTYKLPVQYGRSIYTEHLTLASPGLYQLTTVPVGALGRLGSGYQVYQGWKAESNYFNVDVNQLAKCGTGGIEGLCVRARIASQCPDYENGNNCVWPNPTPKYQTRLYP